MFVTLHSMRLSVNHILLNETVTTLMVTLNITHFQITDFLQNNISHLKIMSYNSVGVNLRLHHL